MSRTNWRRSIARETRASPDRETASREKMRAALNEVECAVTFRFNSLDQPHRARRSRRGVARLSYCSASSSRLVKRGSRSKLRLIEKVGSRKQQEIERKWENNDARGAQVAPTYNKDRGAVQYDAVCSN